MEYASNNVYKNGTISMLLTEEGYATVSGTPAYFYYLKDHQGNNRVVINQGGTVQQVNHDYPFGGLFGEGVQTLNQPYKYNGKELNREFGLDMYDYGARHYDAALGRWFTMDPLAEKYYSISPYVYVANNPVRFIDPDRNDWRNAVKGFLIAVIDNTSGFDFRSSAAHDINNAADFNRGQDIGDMASVLFGSAEMIGGAANAAKGVQVAVVGLATEGPSGGTSTAVVAGGVAQTVQGVAMVAHGSIMAASGSKNLNDQKGRVSQSNPSGKGSEKGNTSSGNKNSAHANQKAKDIAGQKYQDAKSQYDQLYSKPNKTPEDKKQLSKLESQVNHWKKKQDFSGENHRKNAKGNR